MTGDKHYYVNLPAGMLPTDADVADLGVRFRQQPWAGPEARCLIPGCTWSWPSWDESAMQCHARDEWSGTWQHETPTLTGYTGLHTAGDDCPCSPELVSVCRYPNDIPTVERRHKPPTEVINGPEAARLIASSEWRGLR